MLNKTSILYLSLDYMDKFHHDAFQSLIMATWKHIGTDWHFLARALFTSVDEADSIIEQLEHDHRKDRLSELTCGVIAKWIHVHGDQASTSRLICAIRQINRKDILDPKNFEIPLSGKCIYGWTTIIY